MSDVPELAYAEGERRFVRSQADGMVVLGEIAAPPHARRPDVYDQLRSSRAFVRRVARQRFPESVSGRMVDAAMGVGTRIHPALLFEFMDAYSCTGPGLQTALPQMCSNCDRWLGIDTREYVASRRRLLERRARLRRLNARECQICYEESTRLVPCGVCTFEGCMTCVEAMMTQKLVHAHATLLCPVCRTGLSAAHVLSHIPVNTVDYDISDSMAMLIRNANGRSVRMGVDGRPYLRDSEAGLQDIVVVWGGVSVLLNMARRAITTAAPGATTATQLERTAREKFDEMDILPWTLRHSFPPFDEYVALWSVIETHMVEGSLLITDAIMDDTGHRPSAYMRKGSEIVPLHPLAEKAVILCMREARSRCPDHRSKHSVMTFAMVCRLRDKHAECEALRDILRDAGIDV